MEHNYFDTRLVILFVFNIGLYFAHAQLDLSFPRLLIFNRVALLQQCSCESTLIIL